MNKEELLSQKADLEKAIKNILTAGQEFQTRTSRVKMANISELRKQLAEINNQLAQCDGGGYTDTVYMNFERW